MADAAWHMSNNENKSNLITAVDEIVFAINNLLKRKNPILIALDGRSGTGKSTIAQVIASRVESVIVVSDDFYSGGNDDGWSGVSVKKKVGLPRLWCSVDDWF